MLGTVSKIIMRRQNIHLSRDQIIEFIKVLSIEKKKTEANLKKIIKSLAKIEKGEYGFCNKCEEEIPIWQLRFHPSSNLCTSCKSEQDSEDDGTKIKFENDMRPAHFNFATSSCGDFSYGDNSDSPSFLLRKLRILLPTLIIILIISSLIFHMTYDKKRFNSPYSYSLLPPLNREDDTTENKTTENERMRKFRLLNFLSSF